MPSPGGEGEEEGRALNPQRRAKAAEMAESLGDVYRTGQF